MRGVPPGIQKGFDEARSRLLATFEAVARELDALLADLLSRPFPAPGELTDALAERWLHEPAQQCRRMRPLERLLEAIEEHRRRCQELARSRDAVQAPASDFLPDWLAATEQREGRRWGGLVTTVGQAVMEALAPWVLLRRTALRVSGGVGGGYDPSSAHAAWKTRVGHLRRRLQKLLAELAQPDRPAPPRRALSAARRSKLEALLDRRLAWWRRYAEAVTGALALEEALWETDRRIGEVSLIAIAQLGQERSVLLGEMDGLIAWLEGAAGQQPGRQASLLLPEDRLRRWREATWAAVRELLPAQLEVVARWVPLPRRRLPWRLIRPQGELLAALEIVAEPLLLAAFREAGSLHRAILQDLERARQVIAFSQEITEREGEAGKAAAREALQNASLLLRHRRDSLPEVLPWLQPLVRQATAAAFYRAQLELDRDRFGLWGYLAREGWQQAVSAARAWSLDHLRRAARGLRDLWRRLSAQLLARIGWEQFARPAPVRVERREILSESLGVDLAPRGLPRIYQRLFRPEPVEDPRFLVGRQAEMAAMAELRSLWEQGRAACGLVVGERGSGKTSLLNCACVQIFRDVEVVRTQFQHRIWMAAEMRQFLQERVGVDAERRAVVILEELERAFLRCVGGFDAFRELLRTMVATSGRLLWIVAMNKAAFQLLRAALSLERYFSHRVNATTVERSHLEEAILMRHHLTGLRLHFLEPAEFDRRRSRWSARLGLRASPQQAFFDALYRESEGLFRSAFELWLSHIERSEAGVLYVKPLESVNYQSLLADLSLEDLFTLQALMQHGSLTPEEHALVFGTRLKASEDRLELLEDRELIQPDPGRAGYRVRPEAARAVRVALHRSNLL